MSAARHVVPDQVLSQPEPFPETGPIARVPATPFAFLWFLLHRHFPLRTGLLVLLAATATSIEAFGPYALSHLINSIGDAVAAHSSFAHTVLPWLILLALIWLGSTLAYRAYEATDVTLSPRMRALAQKYLFTYLMGHSPRYFQENFAGKLGQKVKQAGQATVSILNILGFEMVRVAMLLVALWVSDIRAMAATAPAMFLIPFSAASGRSDSIASRSSNSSAASCGQAGWCSSATTPCRAGRPWPRCAS